MSESPVRIERVRTAIDSAAAAKLLGGYASSLGMDLDHRQFDCRFDKLPGQCARRGETLLAYDARRRAVGCIAVRPIESDGCCEMSCLYVVPEMRGFGIGKMLLEAMVAEARRMGFREMRLGSPPTTSSALSLCRECGFRLFHETSGKVLFSRPLAIRRWNNPSIAASTWASLRDYLG